MSFFGGEEFEGWMLGARTGLVKALIFGGLAARTEFGFETWK